MRAIQITEFGGPEVLKLADIPAPEAIDGFDLVEVTAAGVNYADTHQVDNSYLSTTELPLVPGSEVVGVTVDGRRVSSLVGTGGYAERALTFPDLTFDLPDEVTDAQALALMVQGLSAWHLLKTSTHLVPGESVVVHAAAGGVGTLAVQLAKAWGAGRVIGVASSSDKRELVESLGADATVDAGAADLKGALQDANHGAPIDIVLEMVGGPTFDASLAALAPFGRLATFGMAGRTPPAPIDAGALMQRSRAVIGFWLVHCLGKPGMVKEPMAEMLAMVAAGSLKPIVGATYPLADARRAHEDLLSRRSTGKLVLDPKELTTRMPHQIDPAFTSLPLAAIADAALQRAQELGVEHADVRLERIRTADLALHDARLETSHDDDERGIAVRVVHDGTWGFAGGLVLSPDEAKRLVDKAVEVAAVSKPVTGERIELAAEPSHGEQTWISSYEIDPFTISESDRIALLADWSHRVLGAEIIRHVDANLKQVRETKYYADLSGTRTTQQRVRMQCQITGLWVDDSTGRFETMRTVAPPVGCGWEHLTDGKYDWSAELSMLPEYLLEKSKSPSVEPGNYDLVVDPSNMWLTIHESIGHATELDRALGYEANYAGTSFATPDKLGSLHYGSSQMHVTGDRQTEHGLATVGFDDEGVAAQTWDLIKDGILVGYQLDRRTAALRGIDRSNGCAFADSPLHVPIQRMANVSLQPVADGPSTEELISGVEDGLYVVGDKSWSIDMQRYNFQFTGQRFFRIKNGRIAGQVRDAAYQATTTDFWQSMSVVGGPETYVLGGAFNCGKGQPGQVAAVSHGCPVALFNGVRILNATQEAGK